jgi:arabinofuranan 3-O-arabinosyltransferase
MVGGVNAAATSAVLPLGALWLLTRTKGARRRAMMVWWPLFTLLATLWWLVPLFLLGSYSPPFLDFIETAGITTSPTNLADALRGTSNWVPYVDGSSRAGNDLLRQLQLPANSAVVLMGGVLGLALRRTPHRLFLASGVVTGLFLVSMGHVGAVQGWFASDIQGLLDGALAPLRNVHKFDPVVRLPLALGLAWLVDWLVEMARDVRTARVDQVNYRILSGVAVFAVLAAATPAAAGHLTPSGGFEDVPDYWHEAADWLADEQQTGVALLAPGTMFGAYVWGGTRDEPFQSLASTPWAVRNAVPLAPAGNIRMLDAIEERFAQGHGSAAFTDYLRRSGVSHVVVRNDLARSDDHPDPVLVHQALDSSPGIDLVATFGPALGGEAHIDGDLGRALVNGGWQNDYAAVEVYEIADPPLAGDGTDQAPVVVGGPEDLLDLDELGVIGNVPTRIASDVGDGNVGDAPVVLTDGYPSVVRHFGRIHDATSPVQTRGEASEHDDAVTDYVMPDSDRWSTFAEYTGIDGVEASSSLSDAGAGPSSLGRLPFAAVDGHASTSWQSSRFSDEGGHWWQVDLSDDVVPATVVVTGALVGDQEVVVSTDDWSSEAIVLAPDNPTSIAVEDTESPYLRITDASGRSSTPLALAEVELGGVAASRVLALPDPPRDSGAPDAIVLRARTDDRTGCAVIDLDVRCVQGREAAAEEPLGLARRVTLAEAASYDVSVLVRGLPGAALEELTQQSSLVDVSASSSGIADPRASALAAVDGNGSTTWSADLSDVRPSLRLRWLQPQTIDSIEIKVDPDTAARAPQSLVLRWRGGRRAVELDEDGTASFAPVRTAQLSVDVEDSEPATSVEVSGETGGVPVGVTELRLGGARGLPVLAGDEPLDLPCGTGPDLVTNGVRLHTSVTASARDLFEGVAVPATPCGVEAVSLRGGDNTISLAASETFTPLSVVLAGDRLPLGGGARVDGSSDGIGGQRLSPDAGQTIVAGHENANPGWKARQGGEELAPVTVDGWRQGWQATGTADDVVATFGPGTTYRWSLLVGALAALLLGGAVLLLDRRRRSAIEPPAVVEKHVHPALVLLVPVVGALLGGMGGAVAALVMAGALWLAGRVHDAVARGLVAALVVPAIGVYAFVPWGGFDAWAGTLAWPSYVVVAVVSGLLVLVVRDSPRRSRPFRRSAGSSTTR